MVIGEFVELFEVALDGEPRSKEGLTDRPLRSRSLGPVAEGVVVGGVVAGCG